MIIGSLTTIQNSCLLLGTFIELSDDSLQMKNIKRTKFYRILIMVNYILNNVLLVDFSLLRVETNSNKRSGNRTSPPKLWAQKLRIAFPV